MVKRGLKRLLALTLSILLALSIFTEALPAAFAAGEPDVGAPTDSPPNQDNSSPITGRPNLSVDFLGDNNLYKAPGATGTTGRPFTPADKDQGKLTNPGTPENPTGNTWGGYTPENVTAAPNSIFWIGVGIDRMNVLEMLKDQNKGAYSLELGFYYNSAFIQPYTGGGDYKAAIVDANVAHNGYPNQWSSEYEVLAAETDLPVATDAITQETIADPSMAEIKGGSTWRMTYVSLEKKPDATGANRFGGQYDVGPDAAEKATQYVLMIPFVLTQHDGNRALCLRLARNATHFSMGAGESGAVEYAAWDKTTVRNPGRELKLQTNFTGDLNIFTGEKKEDISFFAQLKIANAGGALNTATLSLTGDPSPNPVKISEDGKQITGLREGIGMSVDITCASGYAVTVSVTGSDGKTVHQVVIVTSKKLYTFVMPADSVTVKVTFTVDTDKEDFDVFLKETRPTEEAEKLKKGNLTTVTTSTDEKHVFDSNTPFEDPYQMPHGPAKKTTTVTVKTQVHGEYYAKINVRNIEHGTNVVIAMVTPPDATPDGDNVTTLQYGGTFTFLMPAGDMQIEVEYSKAETHKAVLQVYNDDPLTALPKEENVAQLSHTVYDTDNVAARALTGAVYQATNDNLSAVLPGTPAIPTVDHSAALESGSLGGDGKAPIDWKSGLMALVYTAVNTDPDPGTAFFKGKVIPLDVKKILRNPATGFPYVDSEMDGFFTRLGEIARLAKADTANHYKVDVTDPVNVSKILYSYYDLTERQIQVYLLDYAQYEKDLAGYDPAGGGAAPQKPGLLNHTDAVARPLPSWPIGPTSGTLPNLPAVRVGSEVTLTLQAESPYRVSEIKLTEMLTPEEIAEGAVPTETTLNLPTATDRGHRSADFENVFLFTMPSYDCTVRVTYALREVHKIDLNISGTSNLPANHASLSAHTVNTTPPKLTSALVTKTETAVVESVFTGSTVTIKANRRDDYKVSAVVTRVAGGSTIVTKSDMEDGASFTFPMPDGDVKVIITYSLREIKKNDATIHVEHYAGTEEGSYNTALWETEKVNVKTNVPSGTRLTAHISVESGYYIHAVRVKTPTGTVGYTLSGNGYNNGAGTTATPVVFTTTMPGAPLDVYVVFRKGLPPVQPEFSLTVTADDPENMGKPNPNEQDKTIYDDNRVATAVAAVPLGVVGKNQPAMSVAGYAEAGDEVILTLAAVSGYYVAEVTLAPGNLGIPLTWISATQVSFRMPAGDAGVSVRFQKGTHPSYFMTVGKTEKSDTNVSKNTVLSFISPTILGIPLPEYSIPQPLLASAPVVVPDSAASTGAAQPGEKVTLNMTAAAGWYAHSVTVLDGGAQLTCPLNGNGYNGGLGGPFTASFLMPRGNVSATVNFRQGNPDEDRDHGVTLVVTDHDNFDRGELDWTVAANSATLTSAGVAPITIGPLGKVQGTLTGRDYVQSGDTITVSYAAEAAKGFALEVIVVTPQGLRIVPTYLPGNRAQFVMPQSSATVEVRFHKGDEPKYAANLILRGPGNTPVTGEIGGGTFTTPTVGTMQTPIYSCSTVPGTRIDLELLAKDGYYIRAVSVAPDAVGTAVNLTGSFASQTGYFVMPAANVTVNVFFEKLWPDKVKYDLSLLVYDPGEVNTQSGNYANFSQIGAEVLKTPESDKVYGGGSKTLTARALERQEVFVAVDAADGYYFDRAGVTVLRQNGEPVSWWYAPGGIAFYEPGAATRVSVHFKKGTPTTPTVTLHITDATGGTNATALVGGGAPLQADAASTTAAPGTTLTLTATPQAGGTPSVIVAGVTAVEAGTGKQLLVPTGLVTSGGKQSFAMPEGNADVYITYTSPTINPQHKNANLVVSGPTGSGSAIMAGEYPDDFGMVPVSTTTVLPGASDLLRAPQKTPLIVTMTPETGYYVSSVTVTDGLGNLVAHNWMTGSYVPGVNPDADDVWEDNPLQQIAYELPATGATVHVSFAATVGLRDYVAQVVVNDEGYTDKLVPSKNGALLKRAGTDPVGVKKLEPLKAGDLVYLDLTVNPGFKISAITVISTVYGIHPALSLPVTQGQTTTFRMPSDDVTVYVQFATDGLTRYGATLHVSGTPAIPGNRADIHSVFSGKKGPIPSGARTETVSAAEQVEWVTVNYEFVAGSGIESVTVVEKGTTVPVPFTQKDENTITFPMIGKAVDVYVKFWEKASKTHPVQLHMIDLDAENQNGTVEYASGQLLWANTAGADETSATIEPWNVTPAPDHQKGHTEVVQVPAGQELNLALFTKNDAAHQVFIQAAYVLYEDGGQMIDLNLTPDDPGPGFSGQKEKTLVSHPGTTEIYVYVTRTVPPANQYSSVIMLKGPLGDDVSAATMTISGATEQTAVASNGPHGRRIVTPGQTVTITVAPKPGLTVGSILMTPLGIPVTPTRVGGTYIYTFVMPKSNVSTTITLKESTGNNYDARLHYCNADGSTSIPRDNSATISYTDTSATLITTDKKFDTIIVPEGQTVDLKTTMDGTYKILAAYVMQEDGHMVLLSNKLEGKGELLSNADNTLTDAAAAFTMPGSNVDVFVVFSDNVPTYEWYTAVLAVTDANGTQGKNSGKNSAEISSSVHNTTPHSVSSLGNVVGAFLTVEEGESVVVKVHDPAAIGYEFSAPATRTNSIAGAPITLNGTNSVPYTYDYAVGQYNSAVLVHFKATTVAKNPLTVVINDSDNPGDGKVTNTVVAVPGTLPALTVNSVTAAGAYQIVPDVEETTVTLTVKPAPGYLATALRIDSDTHELPLTGNADGTYTATFKMPPMAERVEVTFYQPHSVTLNLQDEATVKGNIATLVASPPGTTQSQSVSVTGGTATTSATIPNLPMGTQTVTTIPTVLAGSSIIGVVTREDNGKTGVLLPTAAQEYLYSLPRANSTVTVVMVDTPTDKALHLATVSTLKAPLGAAASINNTTSPARPKGQGYTVAAESETITVSVTVPTNYTATLAIDGGLTITPTTLTASGDATFTMPNQNAHVTVTFRKMGGFTATLVKQSLDASGTATLSDGTTSLTDSGTIQNLAQGATLTYGANCANPETIAKIVLTEAGTGKVTILPGIAGDKLTAAGNFTMPGDDVTVTVTFFNGVVPPTIPPGGGETPDPETGNLIAFVTTAGASDAALYPNNVATAIVNETHSTTGESPKWMSGYQGDTMRVSFTTEPGYYAVVTAKRVDNNVLLPVVQQGITGSCTAAVTMPDTDVEIRITYSAEKPAETHALTLRLEGHGTQNGNNATLLRTDDDNSLTLQGDRKNGFGDYEVPIDPTSRVYGAVDAAVNVGTELDLSANWAAGYRILKVLVEVTSGGITTTTTLPGNLYGSNMAGLLAMPNADTVVTVVYAREYTATLSVVGETAADTASMTDNRPGTVPVTDGGQLKHLLGEEQIRTTAEPGDGNRLVGVIYSTDKTGAHTVAKNKDAPTPVANRYDFGMPYEDALVTAVFEKDDPEHKSYIAKLTIHGNSVGYGAGGNVATIRNTGNPLAKAGPFWTAAEEKDTVEITVGLEPGYQAKITSARKDSIKEDDSSGDIYVNRISFVITGKTAVFTMPADDATITIQYIRGYTARLELADISGVKAVSTATMADGTANPDTITAKSDGEIPAQITYDSARNPADLDGTATIPALPKDTEITAGVQNATGTIAKVMTSTTFTGTKKLETPPGTFPMPGEDTLVSVLLQNESDPYRQIAKVQLVGESDIVGNASKGISAVSDPQTPGYTPDQGTIWTTAVGDDTVTVNLTVAKGYIAQVMVLRDDSVVADPNQPVYLTSDQYDWKMNGTAVGGSTDTVVFAYDPQSGTPNVSADQTLTFTMPQKTGVQGDQVTDVTVIVEYIYAAKIPAPYDPDRAEDAGGLKQGWIYAENRGDYAVVTIPTLHDTAGGAGTLYNANRYAQGDANTAVNFRFFWQKPGITDPEKPYTELEIGTDIALTPYDPSALATPGDPYNYDNYYSAGDEHYTGAKFKLTVLDSATGEAATALRAILNNSGTLANTQLFVLAENVKKEVSEYTQVVVKKTYAVTGVVYSYAPTHEAKISLFPYDTGVTGGEMQAEHYLAEPIAVNTVVSKIGTGLWRQEFAVRSSELLGDPTAPDFLEPGAAGYAPLTYKLTIEKPAHLTYTRVDLTLEANVYGEMSDTFPISGETWLIAGDVDGSGANKTQDTGLLLNYIYGLFEYSETKDPTDPLWNQSIFNPTTAPYRCDLDGDGKITASDRNIQMLPQHYNRTPAYYNWQIAIPPGGTELPHGFGAAPAEIGAETLELLPDPDAPVDPDMTLPPTEELPIDPDMTLPPEIDGDLPADSILPEPPVILPPEEELPIDPDMTLPPEIDGDLPADSILPEPPIILPPEEQTVVS